MKLLVFSLLPLVFCSGLSVNAPSRRQVLQGASILLGATTFSPRTSSAANIPPSTAIRNIRRSQKQFDSLELLAANDAFLELRNSLRVPPVSELRKNLYSLVRQDDESFLKLYQKFITALEKMDNTALVASRGRKLKEGELLLCYRNASNALGDFMALVEGSEASTNNEVTISQ